MNNKRYQRQIALKEIGGAGQEKLSDAHVIVIGCGGLGCISAPYLAGAGVGKITVIDDDAIELSNLHRQVIYQSIDEGKKKSLVLKRHLEALNPDIEIISITDRLVKSNIADLLYGASIVIEGTDHVYTKYLVNDYCHIHHLPLIYGAIHQYEGYVSTFVNEDSNSIHLRDVFPVPNHDVPTCSEVGVLGTIAGIIGLFQANEAIKYLFDSNKILNGTLLTYEVLENHQYKLKLKKSFHDDINDLYNDEKYGQKSDRPKYEIGYSEIIKDREKYTLVSILDDAVHIDIDDEVLQLEMDEISIVDYEPISEKPIVFYCRTGKKSYGLVALLKNEDPDCRVLSLKGGIKNYQSF